MAEGFGLDVGGHSHTTWASRKRRPAALFDVDSRSFKRPWNSNWNPGGPDSRTLHSSPNDDLPVPSRNVAPACPPGYTHGDGPQVALAGSFTHLQPSWYAYSPYGTACHTGSGDRASFTASQDESISTLHEQYVTHVPEGPNPWNLPQPPQPQVSYASGSHLPLASATQSSPVGPAPAANFDHTSPCGPYSPVTSGMDVLYPHSDTHDHSRHGVNYLNQPATLYLEFSDGQPQVRDTTLWSRPPLSAWQPPPVSVEGPPNGMLLPFPTGTGSERADQLSLSHQNSASNDFYHGPYSASSARSYSTPLLDSDNSVYTPLTGPSRQESMSTCSPRKRHEAWQEQHFNPSGLTRDTAPNRDPEPKEAIENRVRFASTSEYQRSLCSDKDPANTVGSRAKAKNPISSVTRPRRSRRAPFDSVAREETKKTRMMNACVHCRKQKLRCVVNEDDPAAPCGVCQRNSGSTTRKIIHRCDCVRTFTVSSVPIIRQGGLGLTRRWEGTKLVDIVQGTAGGPIRTIRMLQGLCKRPIEVQVQKFIPTDGDVLDRYWVFNGERKAIRLEPYCLVGIHKTAEYVSQYLSDTAIDGFREAVYTSALVRKTYDMVCDHEAKLSKRAQSGPVTGSLEEELYFFRAVIKLVWSMRHTTGSVWLDGEEKLGMTVPDEETYPGYPLKNPWTGEPEVSLPRMVIAQFDSIQNERIMPALLKKVLKYLEGKFAACRHDWFTMYLAIFMLLHEISVASRDRYRWARDHQQKARYGGGQYASLGMYVENFQKASYPLIAYWHYYKVDQLEEVDWNRLDKTIKIKDLEPEQADFIRDSMEMMREEAKHIPPTPDCWEHELFFVSHMFKEHWHVGYRTYNFMDE